MFPHRKIAIRTSLFMLLMLPFAAQVLAAAEAPEEIQVIGITPGNAARQALTRIPYAVQSAVSGDFEAAQTLDLSDFMNQRLGSVNINSAQNNPLQPDIQFRGFTASPLLGLAQGISVYQNGVRINEPLGDAVNWDLLPESAVHQMDLLSGSNPVFGLNTLGGAIAVTMKNGFNFSGHQLEASAGSWGRTLGSVESGGNNREWGYYVNLSHFDEEGWRDLSESDALNLYSALSWRDEERSALDLVLQQGESDLTGNGAIPVGLALSDRSAIFTAPDITANDMWMVDLSGRHSLSDALSISGNVFRRENVTDSFNGDGSEFELCEFSGGAQALFEETDDVEDALENQLDIELDEICDGEDARFTSYAELEDYIEEQAGEAGLDPEDFAIENITDDLSGSGVLSDQAINNISRREQQSTGFSGQVQFTNDLFDRPNQLITGVSYFKGESGFVSILELARLDPLTRSTEGLGVGTFFDEAATYIDTETVTQSWYFSNTLDLTPELAVTLSGRFNTTEVTLRDQSGQRPELNGDHSFSRFNPALGLAWNPDDSLTVYGSVSEANRVPTPIELACNEGVFDLAQQYAIAAGDDPDDVEFECRLPNAFLADPPLADVITRSAELGVRGELGGLRYQAAIFRATNHDDILFQTTGRATGLFANVDETRRQGAELALASSWRRFDWRASYSYIEATFQDNFMVLSPNHPRANADGELAVQSGDRLPGIPEHIVKLGYDFHVTEALTVGMDAFYNGDQVIRGDEANLLKTVPHHAVLNLRAGYTFGDNFSIFARVTNLRDKDYVNFGLLGENPAEILPTLRDRRPVFLGVGAPRAAWVGARLRF